MSCGTPTVNGVPVSEGKVIGGSGQTYNSIADAQAGEAEQSAADVTAGGTVAGTIIATAVPAFLAVGDLVVLTDTTPGNGLACQWATIKAIAGTTLTLDKPWGFGVGKTVAYVRPIVLTMEQLIVENVTFTKNVILNMAGNVLVGSIDFTGGAFHNLVGGGGGIVTNGITTTNLSVTILEDVGYIDLRAGTIYAYIMTNGSDIGATEVYNCGFGGVVSGRRGYGRWIYDNCVCDGVVDSNSLIIPVRYFESVAGIAIVVSDASVYASGQFSGAIFYSENNMTGGTAVVNIEMDVVPPLVQRVALSNAGFFTIFYGVNAGTLTMTWVTLSSDFSVRFTDSINQDTGASTAWLPSFSAVRVSNFTGTLTCNPLAVRFSVDTANIFTSSVVSVEGTSNMTGVVTFGNAVTVWSAAFGLTNLFIVGARGPITTGSVTVTSTMVIDGATCIAIQFLGNQTASTPTVTVSGSILGRAPSDAGFTCFGFSSGVSVSVGTWTVSGSITYTCGFTSTIASLGSGVSGGTWAVSGTIQLENLAGSNGAALTIASSAATGGTLTVSSSNIRIFFKYATTCTLVSCTGAGGSAVITSAATILIGGCRFTSTSTFITATTATSTARCQATSVQFTNCDLSAGVTAVLNSTSVGGIAEGPGQLYFSNCIIGTFTGVTGSGTLTYTTELLMRNCHVDGLITVVLGTATPAFTKFETWETAFAGSSGNKSIAASGTRPTTAGNYRHWRPSMKALINDLKPEVVREWSVLPADAAVLAWGQPVKVNGTASAAACNAASIVKGIVLDVTAGAGGEPTIVVTDGEIFVKVLNGGAVVAGDNLILDPAAFVACILGAFTPAQNIGVALEAEDGTFADKVYASVRVA